MTSGTISDDAVRLLRLTLTPGLGPILARRVLDLIGADPPEKLTIADLASLRGIGQEKARRIARGLREAGRAVDEEVRLGESIAARFLAISDPEYPELLRELPDAPLILSVRGHLHDARLRRSWPVAIVGSRRCTAYGVEQAERFAGALCGAGLTIVSGGARGVDTAAHRAALRLDGHTIAVLGCGLARCYPPENRDLFDTMVESGGALVSELPLRTEPAPENFPARNRIISGMSLGVLAIEAPQRSGALITARIAAEDHAREVFAVPGRIDSLASSGVNHLIRLGGASLVTSPTDVINDLESAARHLHDGTHGDRFAPPAGTSSPPRPAPSPPDLNPLQRRILAALQEPTTLHNLLETASESPERLLPEITTLELRGLLSRSGSHLHATVTLDSTEA